MTNKYSINEMLKRFEENFPEEVFNFEDQTYGDGHYCLHHPDDPRHNDNCYINPTYESLKEFIKDEFEELLAYLKKQDENTFNELNN